MLRFVTMISLNEDTYLHSMVAWLVGWCNVTGQLGYFE